MNSNYEYIEYSPHDGTQYRCTKCGHIVSGYILIATNYKCPHCIINIIEKAPEVEISTIE